MTAVNVSKNTVLLRNICVSERRRGSHAGYAVSFVLMCAAFCNICPSIFLDDRPKRFIGHWYEAKIKRSSCCNVYFMLHGIQFPYFVLTFVRLEIFSDLSNVRLEMFSDLSNVTFFETAQKEAIQQPFLNSDLVLSFVEMV